MTQIKGVKVFFILFGPTKRGKKYCKHLTQQKGVNIYKLENKSDPIKRGKNIKLEKKYDPTKRDKNTAKI